MKLILFNSVKDGEDSLRRSGLGYIIIRPGPLMDKSDKISPSHLLCSKDPSLVELLSKRNNDVFRMIATKLIGKVESSVSSIEREHTKKLIYGILYGMGANTLAEQLECSSEDAAEKIQSFKRSFQGVAS
ncbi:POLAc domain-containing protein [Heracleum sosnowskyi]|uniref:POLAc domain-containing protein n=1 Tax=Heracleum sosnowskyi TaxID=360622 RepID=A0AAD8HV60_9APIA|nr:POLAc domain-containing protein [Heracleum sosnowskyi]